MSDHPTKRYEASLNAYFYMKDDRLERLYNSDYMTFWESEN